MDSLIDSAPLDSASDSSSFDSASDSSSFDSFADTFDAAVDSADTLADSAPDAADAVFDTPTDACSPVSCTEVVGGCGTTTNGCGGVLDCGPCSTTTTRMLSLAAKDVVADATRSLIYVSSPSSEGTRGNRVLAFHPASLTQRFDVFVGSEPGPLAIAEDASVLYVGLDGAAKVRRVDLAARTAGLEFVVGTSTYYGPLYAGDMAVVPGASGSVVISTRRLGVSPDFGGVAVYDDGVRRTLMTPDHTGAREITIANATTVYGFNNSSTEFGFRRLTIVPEGITEAVLVRDLLSGFSSDIVYEGGRVFSTNGVAIDAPSMTRDGTYASTGAIASESSANRVYFVTDTGSPRSLVVYDRTTFLEIGRATLPGVTGYPRRLVRWGQRGLAFVEFSDFYGKSGVRLVVLTSNLVGAP